MSTRLLPMKIRHAVEERGTNLAAVARAAGLSKSALNYALLYPSKRAEEALIAFLGKHPHELWPDRYDAQGNRRVRKPPARKFNSAQRRTKGQ